MNEERKQRTMAIRFLWPGQDLPVGYGLQDLAEAWPGSKVDVQRGRNGSSGRSFHDYHGDRDWAIGDDEGIPTGVPVWVYLAKLGSKSLGEPEILAIAKGRPRLYKEDVRHGRQRNRRLLS